MCSHPVLIVTIGGYSRCRVCGESFERGRGGEYVRAVRASPRDLETSESAWSLAINFVVWGLAIAAGLALIYAVGSVLTGAQSVLGS